MLFFLWGLPKAMDIDINQWKLSIAVLCARNWFYARAVGFSKFCWFFATKEIWTPEKNYWTLGKENYMFLELPLSAQERQKALRFITKRSPIRTAAKSNCRKFIKHVKNIKYQSNSVLRCVWLADVCKTQFAEICSAL